MKRSRDERALKRKSTFGREVAAGEWAVSEWGALVRLLGPRPAGPLPGADRRHRDPDGVDHRRRRRDRAPAGADPAGARTCCESYFDQLRDALATMVQAGLVHGDLSAYNILAAGRAAGDHRPAADRRPGRQPATAWTSCCATAPTSAGGSGARPRGRRAGAVRRADGARVLSAVPPGRPADLRHTRGASSTSPPCASTRWRGGASWRAGGSRPGPDRARRALSRRRVALFLDCTFDDGDADEVRRRGASCCRLPAARSTLPDPALRAARALRHPGVRRLARRAHLRLVAAAARARATSLAQALHDHAIDEALTAWVTGRRAVGVMGGHALDRGAAGVRRRRPARAACSVAAHVVATGGGPGAMEAANLGGCLAGAARGGPRRGAGPAGRRRRRSARRSDAWVGRRRSAVVDASADAASRWASRPGSTATSRPTSFATAIAKYFRNATREAILLADLRRRDRVPARRRRDRAGDLPGRLRELLRRRVLVAPMVLVGREYWTETLPAWPLLRALARGTGDGGARAPRRHRRRGGRPGGVDG